MQAVSNYPAKYDFASDGLSAEERQLLGWADSRIFNNPAFLASKWGPNKWPGNVRARSAGALVELMRTIDIQKKADGKHVISWPLDSLDRVLDDFGVYEGKCATCYGKDDYRTEREVIFNYVPLVTDPGHIHREMLKHFAYFAKADGEGILVRSFMENNADDFQLLYDYDSPYQRHRNLDYFFSITRFAYGFNSFMSLHALADGTIESFPTAAYRIFGGAESDREAAERWFSHLNVTMMHTVGLRTGTASDAFAVLYRPHSATPYSPEPGYLLMVKRADSPSSASLTSSALRAGGIRAGQLKSPENGYNVGFVEIEGRRYHHNGNVSLSPADLPMCYFFATLEQVDSKDYGPDCSWR